MNVVVCVKYVPDSSESRGFRSEDSTVDRVGVEGVLSELDEYAVETAVHLVEDHGGQVTAVTMGPDQASPALQKALQMGADKGLHLVDDSMHGSDAVATSLVLAKVLDTLDYDLVVCGMTSTDGGMGVVPAMLAERLGIPQVTFASEILVEGGCVTIRRDSDFGTETVRAPGKVVVSVTDHIGEARYPSFKAIMAAKKKPVERLELADIGVAPEEVGLGAAGTRVRSVAPSPPRQAGTVVVDDGTGNRAAELVAFLTGQKII